MKVRCTNCMKEFNENKIIYDGDTDMEFCPNCDEGGCLMDLDETETEKSSGLSAENPIDKIVILANDALLSALQQSKNAQVAHIKNSTKDCKIYVMNVKYELGKYRAYMEIIRQVNYNLWLQMYARDNANMLRLNDGEIYQTFGCAYYFIALKEQYKTTAEEHTPEEQEKLGFNPGKFFNELKNANLNKVDFDIMEIKKDFENFKAEEKLWPKKVRRGRCILPIGNIDSMGFNAEYFINIIEVLGLNTEFYQNERPDGTSCFKSDIGMALLCPCRLKNEVA